MCKFFRGLKSFLYNLELGPCPIRSESLLVRSVFQVSVFGSIRWALSSQPRVKLGAQFTSCLFADRSWETLASTVFHRISS